MRGNSRRDLNIRSAFFNDDDDDDDTRNAQVQVTVNAEEGGQYCRQMMVVHGQQSTHNVHHLMSVLAVINPASGAKSAVAFFNEHVAQRLPPDTVVTTERNAVSLINASTMPLVVVLASGDSTLQEILNQLSTTDPPQLSFVLIPCGTANALYSSLFPPAGDDNPAYRLQSLHAFLDRRPPSHLPLATVTISSPTTESQTSIASVVVSTSLHAALAHDSEALRDQHPGVERCVTTTTLDGMSSDSSQ
jgi:hypothetical protein